MRVEVRAGLVRPGEHDGRERLVALEQVDVVDRQPGTAQRVPRRRDGAGEHEHRVLAHHRQRRHLRDRRQPVGAHGVLGRDEQRGGADRDLAGDGGGQGVALAQRRQRRHLLDVRVGPDALVAVEPLERRDLRGEAALVGGAGGAAVALDRELLHALPADVPLLGDQLRAAELADLLLAVALDPARALAPGAHALEHRGVGVDRDDRHVLDARRDHHVLRAREHGLRGEVQRLLGRPAGAVDRRPGHVLGEAGREPRGAPDDPRLRAQLAHAAHEDVVDGAGVDARALHEGRQRVRAEVGGVHVGERALARPDRRADGVDDVRLGQRPRCLR